MTTKNNTRNIPATVGEASIADVIQKRYDAARRHRRRVMLALELTVTALVTYMIFSLLLGIAVVKGSSMEPELRQGSVVLYLRTARSPDAGDIIVVKRAGQDKNVIKRVLAVPGDVVEMNTADQTARVMNTDSHSEKENQQLSYLSIDSNMYFILGDNLDVSSDSRAYGPVTKDEIRGKVILYFR